MKKRLKKISKQLEVLIEQNKCIMIQNEKIKENQLKIMLDLISIKSTLERIDKRSE